MPVPGLEIIEYGEAAVKASATGGDAVMRRDAVARLRERVLSGAPPGIEDVISGLESLVVEFDSLVTDAHHVAYVIRLLAETSGEHEPTDRDVRDFRVPIVISEETAPDLESVASELGVAPERVIEMIEESEFTVALLAAAMAPMMTGLRAPARVRRRSTPRADVPAGSLMIASDTAIMQPFPGPTGWRVVGRTPYRIVDIDRDPPVSFSPGDRFRFVRCAEHNADEAAGRFLEALL